jgi:drug/metabolite transporter (DMT)-like permease
LTGVPDVIELPFIWPHTAILFLCVVLTSVSQLLLKFGSGGEGRWWQSFVRLQTLLGYGLLTLVTILMVFVMQRLELKFVTAVQALIYVLVVIGARFVLKERLTKNRIVGLALIVAGVVVFNFDF